MIKVLYKFGIIIIIIIIFTSYFSYFSKKCTHKKWLFEALHMGTLNIKVVDVFSVITGWMRISLLLPLSI